MAQSTGSAFRDALSARLRFYRDLGITEFYRRPVDTADIPIETCAPGPSVGTWDGNQEKQGAPGPFVGTGGTYTKPHQKLVPHPMRSRERAHRVGWTAIRQLSS